MELEKKLSAILTGQAIPADAAEMVGLAQICYGKKFYSHAASLWDNAFKAEPALADDMTAANRYNAACAAALAGSGNSKDDPPLESSTKGRWYKQALAWLRDDLNSWTKIVDRLYLAKILVSQTLDHWKVDPDLRGIRDEDALVQRPEDEKSACRSLWARLDALLEKSGGPKERE